MRAGGAHQSSRRAVRRRPDQGQPHPAGRRRRGGRRALPRCQPGPAASRSRRRALDRGGRGARRGRRHHPGRQPVDRRDARGGAPRRGARAKVEISGGVTLERMPELAATGADYVSVGRADALRAGRRHQLRDRTHLMAADPGGPQPLPAGDLPSALRTACRSRMRPSSATRSCSSPTPVRPTTWRALLAPAGDRDGASRRRRTSRPPAAGGGTTGSRRRAAGCTCRCCWRPAGACRARARDGAADAGGRRGALAEAIERVHRTSRPTSSGRTICSSGAASWRVSSPRASPGWAGRTAGRSCSASGSTSARCVSAGACAIVPRRSRPSWAARSTAPRCCAETLGVAGGALRSTCSRPLRCYPRRVARARAGQPGRPG